MNEVTETKPNGAEATVTVDVPEGIDPERIARAVADAGARYVVRTDVPAVGNIGELLKIETEGWPSTLAIPSPAGSVHLHLRIVASLPVARAVEEAGRDYRIALKALADELRGDGEEPELSEEATAALMVRYNEQRREAEQSFAEALFDAGVVSSWDEEANGIPFTSESFIALAVRPGHAFLAGLLARFRQLAAPRLEVITSEGEA